MRVWEQSYQRRPATRGLGGGVSSSARLVDRYRVEPDRVSTMSTGEALVVIKSPRASAQIARIRRPPPAQQLGR